MLGLELIIGAKHFLTTTCGLFKKYLLHFTLVKGYVRMNGRKKVFFYILKTWGLFGDLWRPPPWGGSCNHIADGFTVYVHVRFFLRAMQCDFRIRGDGWAQWCFQCKLRWATACCSAVTMPALACIIYPPADWSSERHKRSNSTHTLNRLTECWAEEKRCLQGTRVKIEHSLESQLWFCCQGHLICVLLCCYAYETMKKRPPHWCRMP